MEKRDYQDYLTGISNRMGLFHLYEQLEKNQSVTVMFMDLDNFKTVNDTYGHKKGDEVLCGFARAIESVMPEDTIVGRLGGDEFATIIKGVFTKDECGKIAEKVLESVKELKAQDRAFEIISASIGIIHNYQVQGGLDIALNCADKAMYFAKELGKNTYVIYADYEAKVERESRIERDFFNAMDEGRILIKYHPVHHLQSSRIICTEACCLWETTDGELVGRNDFRPIFLKSGLIDELDMYVFDAACRDYKSWGDSQKKQLISVQFSYLIFLDDSRIEQLKEIIDRYGVSPECIEINLDESMFSSRIMPSKIIEYMNKLKEIGFSISISHFGEDMSSVRYLKDLPISKLKLDGEFISDNIKDKSGQEVLKSIIKLGRGFKHTVIGCGANDSHTMVTLSECGCDAATGDFFSPMLSLDQYAEYIRKNSKDSEGVVSYRFLKDFSSDKKYADAETVGEDIELTKGISNNWGAVRFPGGPSQTNYLNLPSGLFDSNAYTFSFWVKPKELQNWVSAVYVRYQGGFMSFMPNIAGGRCMFRLIDDSQIDVWHDLMSSAIPIDKWTFVTCSYDGFTSIARLYINGVLEAELTDAPALENPKEVWLGSDVFQISFSGKISAFQMVPVSLESDTIRQIYESFTREEGFGAVTDEVSLYSTEIYVHDPAIYEDVENKMFYLYCTGGEGFESRDLIHWKALGKVVDKPNAESVEWTNSEQIWAPDIVKVGDEYRLYCSNSSWGVQQSCIFLAVSDKPEGPFIPKASVLKTDDSGIVNGIDANIIEDNKTHRQYMVYGSFWGGVHIVELDKETGLLKEGEKLGKQIAVRPQWNMGSIEGPYIIYHPETDYYYLFVSYGSLRADYNIRVGRSKCVTGPYLDYHGNDMVAPTDGNCSTGLMISCGYRFLNGEPMMGPGHNSVLLRENGEMYLVNHIRKMAFNKDPGPALLQVRKMIMTPDGWPIAMGEPYNAETLLEVRDALLYGDYERIELRPSIPQGIQHAHPMKLIEGGRLEMASVVGTWERVDTYTLRLEYGPIKEFVHFEKGLDKEKNKTTVVMGGLTSQGICTWAKKEFLDYD